jgi:hypothetical protein
MLKGELTTGAPKQLEGASANGDAQSAQAQPQAQAPYVPPAPPQQAEPAAIPVADLPGEPQDGDGS